MAVLHSAQAWLRAGRGSRWQVLVLGLVTIVVGLPLLFGRVLAGQDIINYLIIAQQTAQNLREWLFFPAWAGGFNGGFGSPLLLFFPPVTGYVNALPVLLGIRVIDGVCLLALVALFLSGYSFFRWQLAIGNRRSALPAAVVYMVAPYRLLDLYLRSALAEHWAFVWPPLILWIASSRRLEPILKIPLLALAVAGLLLTNVPLSMLFGVGLLAWFVVSDHIRGRRIEVMAGAALGFGISAFMLVPQFLSPSMLSLSDCFGATSVRFRSSANTLFSAGFSEWNLNTVFSLVVVTTFVLALIAFLLMRPEGRDEHRAGRIVVGAFACLVVTLGPMGPIWDAVPGFSNLQFPWRVAAVLTLISAVMVSGLTTRRAWIMVVLSAACSLPFSGWNQTVPRVTFLPEKPMSIGVGTVFPDPLTSWEAGSRGGYWRHHQLVELCLLPGSMDPLMLGELSGNRVARFDSIRNRPAVVPGFPETSIQVVEWGQVDRTLAIEMPDDGTVVWRVIWFPGMAVAVDDQWVDVIPDPATGLLSHRLSGGTHSIRWSWRPFAALRRGQVVASVAAFVLTLVAAAAIFGRRRVHGRS